MLGTRWLAVLLISTPQFLLVPFSALAEEKLGTFKKINAVSKPAALDENLQPTTNDDSCSKTSGLEQTRCVSEKQNLKKRF